jgi:CRP-like cAMP-binding protein
MLKELVETHPGISRAMWWLTLTELSRAREWLVNDSRPADKRLAHHFCEMLVCLQAVGLASSSSFEFRLSQVDLADALGISHVHINRVLQVLRSKELIGTGKHLLTIPDVTRLKAFAEFDPAYLCLEGLGF